MGKIIKLIDRIIPPEERTVLFDQDDAIGDDILMVEESLGRPGGHVSISVESASALTIKFNTLQKIYPIREHDTSFMYTNGDKNVTLVREVESEDGIASIVLGADETWAIDKDFPVRNIKVISETGNWSILIS